MQTGTGFSSLGSASLASLHSSSRQLLPCLHSKPGRAPISSCTFWLQRENRKCHELFQFSWCQIYKPPRTGAQPWAFLTPTAVMPKPKLVPSTARRDAVQTVPSHPPPHHHPQSSGSFPPASSCRDVFNLPIFKNKKAGLLSLLFRQIWSGTINSSPLHFNPSLVCILLSHHSTKNSQITNDSYFISPPSNIKASFLTPSSFIPSFPSTSLTPLSSLPVSSPLVVDSQGFAPKALFSLYTKFLVSPSISHPTTGLCA